MLPQEDVEFNTLDRLVLRGRLFSAADRGPGVVIIPGFNCVKEMMGLLDVARLFQEAGVTALIYDPRATGLSDGMPRNEIDPMKQVEDCSDALTFLAGAPTVDPTRMALWGYSLSGAIVLSAAAVDKRAKLVISIGPPTEYDRPVPPRMRKLLAKCIKDRESQLKGNPPYTLPVIDERGESPAGMDFGIDKKSWAALVKSGKPLATTHVNRTTLQTFYKIAMWQPRPLWRLLDATPVLMVLSELEPPGVLDDQVRCFESLPGPKRLHIEPGVGHINILDGEHLMDLTKVQIEFLRDALEGKIRRATSAELGSAAEERGG